MSRNYRKPQTQFPPSKTKLFYKDGEIFEMYDPDYVQPWSNQHFDMRDYGFNRQNYKFNDTEENEMFNESAIPEDEYVQYELTDQQQQISRSDYLQQKELQVMLHRKKNAALQQRLMLRSKQIDIATSPTGYIQQYPRLSLYQQFNKPLEPSLRPHSQHMQHRPELSRKHTMYTDRQSLVVPETPIEPVYFQEKNMLTATFKAVTVDIPSESPQHTPKFQAIQQQLMERQIAKQEAEKQQDKMLVMEIMKKLDKIEQEQQVVQDIIKAINSPQKQVQVQKLEVDEGKQSAILMIPKAAEYPAEKLPEPLIKTEPMIEPLAEPKAEPTVESTVLPIVEPLVEPTLEPKPEPIMEPTFEPIIEPKAQPSTEPTHEPDPSTFSALTQAKPKLPLNLAPIEPSSPLDPLDQQFNLVPIKQESQVSIEIVTDFGVKPQPQLTITQLAQEPDNVEINIQPSQVQNEIENFHQVIQGESSEQKSFVLEEETHHKSNAPDSIKSQTLNLMELMKKNQEDKKPSPRVHKVQSVVYEKNKLEVPLISKRESQKKVIIDETPLSGRSAASCSNMLEEELPFKRSGTIQKPKVKPLRPKEFKKLVESQKIELHVRKNQFDNTAALVYGLNVSLIHFALFVMIAFVVHWPDIEMAKLYDDQHEGYDFLKGLNLKKTHVDMNFEDVTCHQQAVDMHNWLKKFVTVHMLCFLCNLQREIFDTKLGSFGQAMKALEVILLGTYNFGIIQGLSNISIFYYWRQMRVKFPDHSHKIRQCFIDQNMLDSWAGTSGAMITIEVFVYFSFLLTLVFYISRSRCLKRCGINNSEQFEDTYSTYLVNRIIQSVVFKGDQVNSKFKFQHYVDKERTVNIENIVLKIKLTAKDFLDIKHKLEEDEKTQQFVAEEDAISWLNRCLIGEITKFELDQQRQAESNVLDQMQNTNFVYHPESLIEMQIIITYSIYYLSHYSSEALENAQLDGHNASTSNFIIIFLFAEHCFSYVVAFYRSWDIDNNGQLDINGIKRAPMESLIGNVQFFIGCIIIGFSIKHYSEEENQKGFKKHDQVLQNYWILIDLIIVFLGQSYISTSLFMKVSGEVTKNLYSLHFLQANKIQAAKIAKQNLLKSKKLAIFQSITKSIQNSISKKDTGDLSDALKSISQKKKVAKKLNSKHKLNSLNKNLKTSLTQQVEDQYSSDDDTQEGEQSEVEEPEDNQAKEKMILDKYNQVMAGTNKKLKTELQRAKEQIIIVEDDYKHEEIVMVPMDVYNLTIAANMTKDCSPLSLVFCLRQCIVVFLLQFMVAFFFSYEIYECELVQPFGIYKTFLRIVVPILMTLQFSKELSTATKMLTFLKRIGHTSKYANSRLTNIMLCSLQILAPLITIGSLITRIIQESALSQITKAFACLSFVVNIDDMFASSFPLDVKVNAQKLNSQKKLKLTKDYNSFEMIFKRMRSLFQSNQVAPSSSQDPPKQGAREKKKEKKEDPGLISEIINIMINVWYLIVVNFQLCLLNYFSGIMCVLLQILGFYVTMTNQHTKYI